MQQDQIRFPLRWKNVLLAGFLAGVCFMAATSGNVWGPSALTVPTVMGRELTTRDDVNPSFQMSVPLLHLAVSMVYAAIIAMAVRNMRIKMSVLTGAAIGLVLYGLNYVLFNYALHSAHKGSEVQAALTHLVFGMLAAAAYTGLTRRTVERAPVVL